MDDVVDVDGLASIMACGVSSLPLKYISFLLEPPPIRPSLFGMVLLKKSNVAWLVGK